MRKLLLFLFGVFLIICSCNKQDNNILSNRSIDVFVEATMPEMEEDVSTKASLRYVIQLSWVEGNTISVYNMTNQMTNCGTLKAQSSGTSTTFTGRISGVNESDKLILVYSSGLDFSTSDGAISIDFSNQNLATLADSASFVTIAQVQLSNEQINNDTVTIKPSFEFPFAFMQISMGGLPSATKVQSVDIYGLKYNLSLSYSETDGLVKTIGPEPQIGTDGMSHLPDHITITPPSTTTVNTTSSGTRSLYVSFPNAVANASLTRDVIITLGSSSESAHQYRDAIVDSKIAEGKHHRTTLAHFQQYDKQLVSYSVLATHPAAMTNAPETESNTTWKAGETMTLINLTTKEVFGGSLVAESAGKTVTFSSNNLSCFHGLNAGDELLLVSPAIYTGENATVFDEGGITIEGLIGSTFADAKPTMSGTTIITKYSDSHAVEFDYLTSTVGLTVDVTAQSSSAPRMKASSNEGFTTEFGLWDGEVFSKIVINNLPVYVLAYDATVGHKVTAVQNKNTELTLTGTFNLEGTNPLVYYSIPAIGSTISPTVYLYTSSTEFYSCKGEVTTTNGCYVVQSAIIDETGDDMGGADPGDGGIG